jgi:hypothetical protein
MALSVYRHWLLRAFEELLSILAGPLLVTAWVLVLLQTVAAFLDIACSCNMTNMREIVTIFMRYS